jgi:ubiquinone/menaquinone biosynthesis C-methylase UbiE
MRATGPGSQHDHAIEVHSTQAPEFDASYRALQAEPYATCFAYSRRRLDALLERTMPGPEAGPRLLDVGCGTGFHLARLRARGFEVAGIDGSGAMLDRARAANPGVDLRLGDVGALPFPDARFDVVLCVEVLRYLADPEPCLKEMARVLRPGGVCLVTAAPLLNLNGYWLVNRLATRVPIRDLVRLKQFFTTSARLRGQLHRAGFGPVDVHGVYLGPINWVERLLPRALPPLLKAWEPLDAAVCDRPLLRELANMFLVRAVRRG